MKIGLIVLSLLLANNAFAAEYYCKAIRKVNPLREFPKCEIDKWEFATRIEDYGERGFISRCARDAGLQKVVCERYPVDKIVRDRYMNVTKYYNFTSQFNIQIHADMNSVMDNGRENIEFGICSVVVP